MSSRIEMTGRLPIAVGIVAGSYIGRYSRITIHEWYSGGRKFGRQREIGVVRFALVRDKPGGCGRIGRQAKDKDGCASLLDFPLYVLQLLKGILYLLATDHRCRLPL